MNDLIKIFLNWLIASVTFIAIGLVIYLFFWVGSIISNL